MTQPHNRTWRLTALLAAALLAPAPAAAATPDILPPVLEDTLGRDRALGQLARLAVDDGPAAAAARVRLRAAGPAGLAAFEKAHAAALDAAAQAIEAAADAPFDRADPAGLNDPARARLLSALDAVCGQRDCVLSRLYWHTDLAEATRRAQAEGKPILSLRLLGDLRDELSCANSRFFRALLYPHPAVQQLLRQRFVLHWSSERAAPKLTIDLGDGRTVTSTITGNSAHYVLDSRGRPVDVVPGLLTPASFAEHLGRAAALARATARQDGDARRDALVRHHTARLAELDASRAQQAVRLDGILTGSGRPARLAPRAGQAARIAISKAAVEVPTLERLGEPVDPETDAARRERLAATLAPTIDLARASLGLMRVQQWRSGDVARDTDDFAAAQAGLRRTLALDTLRNTDEIRREIHGWFISGAAAALDLAALNRWVYDELFLTPARDPWLGLADPGTYGGLVGGGRRAQAHL